MLCCHTCHLYHLTRIPSHTPFATEVIFRILGSPNNDAESADQCDLCDDWTDYRLECVDCQFGICVSCWRSKDRPLWPWYRRHREELRCHGRVRYVLPPIWFLEAPSSRDCDCLLDRGTVIHCERCCACIDIHGTVHRCLTCLGAYGCSQLLCSRCANKEIAQHKDHLFRRILICSAPSVSDALLNTFSEYLHKEMKIAWRCMVPMCDMGLGDFNAPAQWLHPRHSAIFWEIGDILAGSLRIEAPKRCVKTRLARLKFQDPPNATEFECDICEKKLAYDVLHAWCITCKALICTVCINTGRSGHRHALYDLLARLDPQKSGKTKICKLCRTRCMTSHDRLQTPYVECNVCREYRWCLECCFTRAKASKHETCGNIRSEWRMYGAPSIVTVHDRLIENRAILSRGQDPNVRAVERE